MAKPMITLELHYPISDPLYSCYRLHREKQANRTVILDQPERWIQFQFILGNAATQQNGYQSPRHLTLQDGDIREAMW